MQDQDAAMSKLTGVMQNVSAENMKILKEVLQDESSEDVKIEEVRLQLLYDPRVALICLVPRRCRIF